RPWTGDGTENGTHQVLEILPGGDPKPDQYLAVGSHVVFTALNADGNRGVWSSRGDARSTKLQTSLPADATVSSNLVQSRDGTIYFAVNRPNKGSEIWRLPTGLGSIAGTLYHDDNANGAREFSELPIAGARVFIDANANGVYEDGERVTLTNNGGRYHFNDVPAGRYWLGVVAQNLVV